MYSFCATDITIPCSRFDFNEHRPSRYVFFISNFLSHITTIGAAGLQQLIGPYLDPTDFSTDTCGRTCFQNYQNASHAFYSTCRPQLNETLVPLAFAIQNFQEYRNQACG